MIKITRTNYRGEDEVWLDQPKQFSAGEEIVKIPTDPENNFINIQVTAEILNSSELVRLWLISEAIHKYYGHLHRKLVIPYLPYSRQDRRCHEGEADSLFVIWYELEQYYDELITYDVHNEEESKKTIFNLCNIRKLSLLEKWPVVSARLRGVQNNCILISPDKGALEESYEISRHFDVPFGAANKIRDEEGKIVSLEMPGLEFQGEEVFIFDDICDGGRTFIELSKLAKHKGASKVILYVTHGILSHGCEELNEWIDEMYIYNYIGKNQLLTGNIFVRDKDV